MMRKSRLKPKFEVGDDVFIANPNGVVLKDGGGFGRNKRVDHGAEVRVVARDVRKRARDPRPNRYYVKFDEYYRGGSAASQCAGWVYEDDLDSYGSR